jgi:hydroxyacylglutathione hydrolase
MTYKISPIKAFTDNYIWALHKQKHALVVDPGDAAPVIAFLEANKLELSAILITHHHFDHTGGIAKLSELYPSAVVYGPNNPMIQGVHHALKENDAISIDALNVSFTILHTPGHTLDHIVYVHSDFIFCGDTLFSGGCGRMFEGTPEVFHASLAKLAALPSSTKVYCTHEYTQANLAFARSVDTQNPALKDYSAWVNEQRNADKITLPSTIAKECEINPFLRCHNHDIRRSILKDYSENSDVTSDVETFAVLRKLKDNF